jgi:hypothetical protein
MTTPTDEERVATVMREMLNAGAVRPAPVTPAELRHRAGARSERKIDAKVVVALAAVAAVVVALIVFGPLRSSNGPVHSPVATHPSTTTTTTPPTTTPPPTTLPAGATAQRIYYPFTSDGAVDPSLQITSTQSATTCVASGVAGNSSYRCFAGDTVEDPCFARQGATTGPLVCTNDPASPEVVELTTSSLPAPLQGAPDKRPWAIELSDGQVCIQVNAAWGGLGPLSCGAQPTGPVADCHVPVDGTGADTGFWTAACQDQLTDGSPFTTFKVETVWS